MAKTFNVALRCRILFQALKVPVPGWSSLLLITEASRSGGCWRVLAWPEKSCLQQSASNLNVMQKGFLLTALTPGYCNTVFIGTDMVALPWPAYQNRSATIQPKF